MENSQPTIEERQEKDRAAILEALKETPIVAVACKKAGVGRATFYRWRKDDPMFFRQTEDAMTQGFDLINDMSEGQIIALIREKKMPAITLWLKHHHPRYGAKNQTYKPIATAEELSPEERDIMFEALALASGANKKDDDGNQPTTRREDPNESEDSPTNGV